MTGKMRSLAERRESLLRMAATQRDDMAFMLGNVDSALGRVDDGLAVAGRWLNRPLMIGIALSLVLVLGRRRSLRTLGTGLGLLGTLLRARIAVARLTARHG